MSGLHLSEILLLTYLDRFTEVLTHHLQKNGGLHILSAIVNFQTIMAILTLVPAVVMMVTVAVVVTWQLQSVP
jgi:hypothetical protein